jgi:hypothetical protein
VNAKNAPRQTRQLRRSKDEIRAIEDALYATLEEDNPATVRQVFYRLVSGGVIEKNEAEYKATVVRLLARMRRDGLIPYAWIADNTRQILKPPTYDSPEEALHRTAATYRRAIWTDHAVQLQIWIEKDALAGVLYQETAPYDVPLCVSRGYASLTYLHETAADLEATAKPAYIYQFGDFDPSGVDISRKTEEDLRAFAPNTELHFERVAVTPEQIRVWNLPTRPTKRTDSRSHGFEGESVEVDAIPPGQLRDLVRECIEGHLDEDVLAEIRQAEATERAALLELAESWE